ncbi:acyl carrier protein [Spartinivicinus poritis]|uniref:Acyl carrier protein n=1 Tax=Spartinivicinus poritis TaxID=2994640 RepID=A0ABT5U574_9GAMM|nr:acyl carrier protein [Spartinivicinus sp. A2-2]MDE1461510.1 acyl carrier protein [Spartinivicinus sp. A2-2]
MEQSLVETESIKNKVVEFITSTKDIGNIKLDDDVPLLKLNILDSISLFELIAYLQEEFGMLIPMTSVKPENFHSISAICHMVKKYLK